MKARLLKKILNDTKYIICHDDKQIKIGSAYIPDIITVSKKLLSVKHNDDTFMMGRASLRNAELEFIWDRLHWLIDNGQINEIINGDDEVENPLPVYTVIDGQVVKKLTDKYGYPNTTLDGCLMHKNMYYEKFEDAIEYGIKEYAAFVSSLSIGIDSIKLQLSEAEEQLEKYNGYLNNMRELQAQEQFQFKSLDNEELRKA